MGKNIRLVNIYLKIHHKRTLTMDDLAYLAEYDPECFVKTCKNVVYNIPETKPIMDPPAPRAKEEAAKPEWGKWPERIEWPERQNIEMILRNLKQLERDDFPAGDVDSETIKSLLGNLYMELLFPHNDDKETFFNVAAEENGSLFDRRA